jgi:hypothetical protein
MQHRDQIFQWYTLHRNLGQGQKIVQLGPFQPLTIVDNCSGINNGHVASGGIDRLLIDQGDELLQSGRYTEAENFYRRCLNFVATPIPEAQLRLILCLLHKGNSKAALTIASKLILNCRLGKKDLEPDPTEWAWFIIVLLCCGKNREAALRAGQFTNVHNEELHRVRCLVRVLSGETPEIVSDMSRAEHRASVHQLAGLTMEAWLENIGRMLEACGQKDTANMLAGANAKLQLLVVKRVSDAQTHGGNSAAQSARTSHAQINQRLKSLAKPVGNAVLEFYLAVNSQFDRLAQKTWPKLRRLVRQISGAVLNRSLGVAEGERSVIVGLLQKEEAKSGILIGATSDSWLSEAFMCGMQSNPNMPSVVCLNYNTPGFRKFHRRFVDNANVEFRYVPNECQLLEQNENADVIAVNCSILKDVRHLAVRAPFLLLNSLENKAGSEFFQVMSSDDNYLPVFHDPSQCGGYAVFRRVVARTEFSKQRATFAA